MITKKIKILKSKAQSPNDVWVFDKDGMKEEILVKVVVEDGAKLEAKGLLKIAKNVTDVDVFLRYKVLLLGKNSWATVNPELEIESNDVKAGHAASIGRVDEEQIFYLMSRGISRNESVKLIVEAFLND
jgi:Fe-S cluster assembly scaffold protein SufB